MQAVIYKQLSSWYITTDAFIDLLDECEDVNWHPVGENPLIVTQYVYNNPYRIDALIRHGVDVNLVDNYYGLPAYWHTVCPECLKLMIDAGADVNFKNSAGSSLLGRNADIYSKNGYRELVQPMLDAK